MFFSSIKCQLVLISTPANHKTSYFVLCLALFSLVWPFGRFSLKVTMSVCQCVCVLLWFLSNSTQLSSLYILLPFLIIIYIDKNVCQIFLNLKVAILINTVILLLLECNAIWILINIYNHTPHFFTLKQ